MFGKDPVKRKTESDISRTWDPRHAHFHSNPTITAAELLDVVFGQIESAGYGHGLGFVGRLVG